jgi:hypothetical protein
MSSRQRPISERWDQGFRRARPLTRAAIVMCSSAVNQGAKEKSMHTTDEFADELAQGRKPGAPHEPV